MTNMTREELISDAVNKSKIIAFIYSPTELYEYIVEIVSKDTDTFIQKGHQNTHFSSVDEALSSATRYGAEAFFLCADNTYGECSCDGSGQKFDCIPIHSKYKETLPTSLLHD